MQVQYKRLDLLNHPVIGSLVHHKWFAFGLWGYLLNLLIYVIFLVILTSFALIVPNPQSATCTQNVYLFLYVVSVDKLKGAS